MRRATRRSAIALAATAALAGVPSVPVGHAQSQPTAPEDTKQELAKLEKQAARLEKEYRGNLELLRDARRAAERATVDSERRNRELDAARSQIRTMAAGSYMAGGGDPVQAMLATDGASMRGVVITEYLARNNNRRIQRVTDLSAAAKQSHRTAQAKIKAAQRELDDLAGQRKKVKKLLAKHKPETPKQGRPDGVSGKTKSPLVGNYMTPRMRQVLQEVDGKFGPFPTIGCHRPGDPQDHGTGRACDFMESTGGRMPTASATAHGDSVAQYVISNASRLGIKYVIWRQRIYDMRNPGWRQMEDRGSVTANHYDHPHVSVL
ncbi:hypothetical protein GCM10010191_49270 [Actinomadura vinacea]|uniref:ARB-07466-like C-terminal domain-containing protein n=1 Tax=Actinomadura vinacea TaxID=115336 RepID=A0ABN3JIW0_9ACTN